MSLYKRSSFCYNKLKNFLFPKNQVQSCIKIINLNTPYNNSSNYNYLKPHGVIGSPSISSKLVFRNGFNNKFDQQCSLISRVSRRNYHVDSDNIQHLIKQTGYKTWIQNPRKLLKILGFGCACVVIYDKFSEVVPFTKRKHLLLFPREFERMIGELVFDHLKESVFKGKILPPLHPDNVRVRLIMKNVIKALHQTTASESSKAPLSGRHLEGMNWEVMVVKEPEVNAFCLPGGKIVVYTGLLERCKSDVEVATVMGHEVGHVVARHSAEDFIRQLCLKLLQWIFHRLDLTPAVDVMSNILLQLPFSRKMEMEADYIGLLLTAAAGYDPRIAPQVYTKLGVEDSGWEDYLSTHPCGKTRAQRLARSYVMDEALSLYRKAIAERRNQLFATVARLTRK